jgi:hypothetical protein
MQLEEIGTEDIRSKKNRGKSWNDIREEHGYRPLKARTIMDKIEGVELTRNFLESYNNADDELKQELIDYVCFVKQLHDKKMEKK